MIPVRETVVLAPTVDHANEAIVLHTNAAQAPRNYLLGSSATATANASAHPMRAVSALSSGAAAFAAVRFLQTRKWPWIRKAW